jgi:hypothetical protein
MSLNLNQYGDVFSDDEKHILEELYANLTSLLEEIELNEQNQTPEST